MPKLFIYLCEAEGLVDLVPFTFVANQSAGVSFLLKDATDHGAFPQILLFDLFQLFRHSLA